MIYVKKNINQYKEYLITQGKSENTIKNYMCDLNKFCNYFEKKKGKGDVFYSISVIDLMEYVNYIKYHGGRKNTEANPKTINRNITTLKKFYQWMKRCNIIRYNHMLEIEFVSVPRNEDIVYMDVEESRDFLNTVHKGANKKYILADFTYARDELMFKLYLETGVRCAELINVKLKDIDIEKKIIKILGKNNKTRYVAINDKTIELYKNYLLEREKADRNCSQYLLLSVKGNKMNPKDIWSLTKKYSSMSNLNEDKANKMSTHKLRHSYASIQYAQKTPVQVISKNMGHTNTAITENIYIHFSNTGALDLSRKNSEILDNY